jgi:hypothetical protein
LENLIGESEDTYKFYIYIASIAILIPLSFFESMEQISYISIIAMTSIVVAIVYIIGTDF